MKIESIRLRGIRCFEDTGEIALAPGCNIFVGQNNAGKSTVLKGVLGWQLDQFSAADARPDSQVSGNEIVLVEIKETDSVRDRPALIGKMRFMYMVRGAHTEYTDIPSRNITNQSLFRTDWPNNTIIPFIAKRKSLTFSQNINADTQASITGTFQNLYARMERVVSPGTVAHEKYRLAIENIAGVYVTTNVALNGKEAGYWFDEDNFVTMDRMGDGISEMVALIVDLSLAKNKIFILEEPETNLHPKGLKALLELVRESSKDNQFIIATHSNIVVRELATSERDKVFRVYRNGEKPSNASNVLEVQPNAAAHLEIMRELGYEFGDFDLHDAWLFLEESSAEEVIRDILIPWFAPQLRGRVRTFSAAGVSKLEPSVAEFQRLISFVHLEPVYRDRIWIRADNDGVGMEAIVKIQEKFDYLAAPRAQVFSKSQFEYFYPAQFEERITATLAISDKATRRSAKNALRADVIAWSKGNEVEARLAWQASAAEQIELLGQISAALD